MNLEEAEALYIKHYGVKGMKWGVRRDRRSSSSSSSSSNIKSMSDQDLQRAVQRMNLERQYQSLAGTSSTNSGAKFLQDIALNVVKTQLLNTANQIIAREIKKKLGL